MRKVTACCAILLLALAGCGDDDNPRSAALDTSFRTGKGISHPVNSILVQPDGKILVAGGFTAIDGQMCNRIVRFLPDGSLDPDFQPGYGANSQILSMALQAGGRIVIGGYFNWYDGVPRQKLARLHPDGSLDLAFDTSSGANDSVNAIHANTDGTILIAGDFTTYAGISRPRLAEVHGDGSLVSGFNPGTGVNDSVKGIHPNGSIFIIVGLFTEGAGTTCNRVARVGAGGNVSAFPSTTGAGGPVYALAAWTNKCFLIGGNFTSYDGTSCGRIIRIDQFGVVDPSFDTGSGANNAVYALAVQPDGKILVGGIFTQFDGAPRNRLARLNPDGSLDTGFDPGAGFDNQVNVLAIQADGGILSGGAFSAYDGTDAWFLTRIHP